MTKKDVKKAFKLLRFQLKLGLKSVPKQGVYQFAKSWVRSFLAK
jgi:hypothetical protein